MKPRVLLLHNASSARGGADRCVLNQKNLLEEKGHDVAFFTAEGDVGLLDFKFTNALSYMYHRRAAQKLCTLLDRFQPDLAHAHNIYGHLTPSVLVELKRRGIPVVMTLHDWKLICPNHRLFTQGALCERCQGGRFFQALLHRCFRDSVAESFLGMVEAYVHHAFRLFEGNVDLFISPSRFLQEKFCQFGWDPGRITVIGNFVAPDVFRESTSNPEGMVFCGEVSEGKGIFLLFEALRLLRDPRSLRVVGEGPALPECRRLAGAMNHRIEFLSHREPVSVYPEIQKSLFTVLPALWYENQPLAILESYALGRAVIGSNHGGIAELIEDQETGLLSEPGNPKSLASAVEKLLDDPKRALEMGRKGQDRVLRDHSPERHYQKIMEVYSEVMNRGAALRRVG